MTIAKRLAGVFLNEEVAIIQVRRHTPLLILGLCSALVMDTRISMTGKDVKLRKMNEMLSGEIWEA